MQARKFFAALLLLAPLATLFGATVNSISFNQVDFYHNGSLQLANSAWGEFIVNFAQDREGASFLNVVRQGPTSSTWIIRNLPLPSTATTGTTALTIERDIDLGVANGTSLVNTQVGFQYIVTAQPMSSAPSTGTSGTATIGSAVHQSNSGIGGGPNDVPAPPQPPAAPAPGPVQTTSVWHRNMINVPQSINQCLPGAMTNSLQWLNLENNYNLNQNPPATLTELAGDMGTTAASGSFEEPAVSGLLKFISAHNLPVEVHYYGGGAGNSHTLPGAAIGGFTDPFSLTFVPRNGDVSWQNLLNEMQKQQNVVALLAHHAIVIEGLTDEVDENGNHHRSVNYREDPIQGSGPAGEKLDTLSQSKSAEWTDADPALGTTALLNNDSLLTLLVESPIQPAPASIAIPSTGEFGVVPLLAIGACTGINNIVTDLADLSSFSIIQLANGTVQATSQGSANVSATGQFSITTGMYNSTGTLQAGSQSFPIQLSLQSEGAVSNGPPAYSGTITIPVGSSSCAITFVAALIGQQLPAALTDPAWAGDPISSLTGEVTAEPRADLALGGPLNLEFRRYYGSLLALNGISSPLGANWMSNFDVRAFVSGATASVVTFHGGVIRFTNSKSVWSTLSPYAYDYQFQSAGAGFSFLDPSSNLIYAFGSDGKLTRISDRNGNSISVVQGATGPTIIADNFGRSFTFTYSNGQLTKVQDQSGRSVSYAYSGASLVSFTDAAGKVTNYSSTNTGPLSSVLARTTLPAGNVLASQAFDQFGRATSQTDGDGNTTSLNYGLAVPGDTSVTDARGNTWTQSHPNLFDFTGSTDPNHNVAITGYDASGRPISLVDRNGNTSSIAYHAQSGYIASITDAEGNTTSYRYGATNSPSTPGFTVYDFLGVTYADGSSTSFTRDFNGNLLKQVDAAGNTTSWTYNSAGQPLTMTNPAGGITTLTYNSDGTAATRQSPAGDVTTFSYDTAKRPILVKYADGSTRVFTYDALDRITQTADERSKRTQYSYTDNGKLSAITDPFGNTSSVLYDTADHPLTVTTPTGKSTAIYNPVGLPGAIATPTSDVTNFAYDKLNRLSGASDSTGTLATIGYDNEKSVSAVTDGANRTTIFTLDRLGRPFLTITPQTEFWQTNYTARDRIASVLDPLGNLSSFTYDANDRLSKAVLPAGIQASYTRDALGGITTVVDPNNSAWRRQSDNLGRLILLTDPLAHSLQLKYDSRNRVASAAAGSFGSAQFTYDGAGHLTHAAYSDGTALDYTYDDAGRLTGGTGFALAYDASGRITTSNGLGITRDAAGRVTSVQYPPGNVTYAYNSRGLVSQITDWTGATTRITYEASLRLASIARPNGIATNFSYDGNGNLSSIIEARPEIAAAQISLTRDAGGRIVSSNRTLPQAAAPAAGSQNYSYDGASQLAAAAYDFLGRLTQDSLRTYTWDLASRLTSYSGSDGSASFTYDGLGSRLSRTSQGATQNFVIDYALPLPSPAMVKNGAANQTYYVYLPDGTLFASIDAQSNAHRYYHFDESGNTVFLSDDSGNITDSYGITPYGESVTASGSTANPFTWQGKFGVMQEGSTSMFYLRARYYDSAPARFLSRDPLTSIHPLAVDPYQYATGNPISRNDPAGLAPGQITTSTNFPGIFVDPQGNPINLRTGTNSAAAPDPAADALLKLPALPQLAPPLSIPTIFPSFGSGPVLPFANPFLAAPAPVTGPTPFSIDSTQLNLRF